ESIKKETAESLLEQGEITGEEYLSILQTPGTMEIYGVEDEELYMANLKARKILDFEREELLRKLHELDARLRRVKNVVYSRKLLELDGASAQFENQKITLKQFFSY